VKANRAMTLYAGFHVESDMCLIAELESLAHVIPTLRGTLRFHILRRNGEA